MHYLYTAKELKLKRKVKVKNKSNAAYSAQCSNLPVQALFHPNKNKAIGAFPWSHSFFYWIVSNWQIRLTNLQQLSKVIIPSCRFPQSCTVTEPNCGPTTLILILIDEEGSRGVARYTLGARCHLILHFSVMWQDCQVRWHTKLRQWEAVWPSDWITNKVTSLPHLMRTAI